MKKLRRLIEIKRQIGLANNRINRATIKRDSLRNERRKILDSLTAEEVRLYKDRIEAACK